MPAVKHITFFLVFLVTLTPGFPQLHAADREKTVLTVSGRIASATPVEFSIASLESLPAAEIKTTTPWHDGEIEFAGVLLKDLIAHIQVEGTDAEVVALNDYRSTIPLSDFDEYGPILAYKQDGAYMPVRNKGPLFIIYPFDANPDLKSEIYYSRSVWQVRSIEIK